jgi:transposase
MARPATSIILTDTDRNALESWVRASTTEQRFVLRARIVLAAADGKSTESIADGLDVRTATVSRWRTRFAAHGITGLEDRARSGKPITYDAETERRILAKLDESPPSGYSSWSGSLLAQALGDVSKDHIWRVLRKHRISLQRRRSWCVSTDPEFVAKAADIVGLYLDPPDGALVLCVDEKPSIQALERAQGWLKLPNGRALTGYAHEYKRHGITNLFTALEVASGQVQVAHKTRKRRREFLSFMNELVDAYPDQELHVILDNYSTHKPKHDRWLAMHPLMHFHYTPTHASWLNMVEIWFSMLWRQALRGQSFTSPQQVRRQIDKYVAAYNPQAMPFEWTKADVRQVTPKDKYAELCK